LLGGSIESGSAGLLFAFFGFWLVVLPLILHRERKPEAQTQKPASKKYKVLTTIVLILWGVVIFFALADHFTTDKDSDLAYGGAALFFFAISSVFSFVTLMSWLEDLNKQA
jgi:hypothetical protein